MEQEGGFEMENTIWFMQWIEARAQYVVIGCWVAAMILFSGYTAKVAYEVHKERNKKK